MSTFAVNGIMRGCGAIALVVFLWQSPACSQDANDDAMASAAEEELIEMVAQFWKDRSSFQRAAQQIKDLAEQSKYYDLNNPVPAHSRELLSFEERHRGTHVGLMAVRQLSFLPMGGGPVNDPTAIARREALTLVKYYGHHELLCHVLLHIDGGNPEPEVQPCLRSLIADSRTLPVCREFAKFCLARWVLRQRATRDRIAARVAELKGGATPVYPIEFEHTRELLDCLPTTQELATLVPEARSILQQLATLGDQFREPTITTADKYSTVVRKSEENVTESPFLSTLADGLLFREEHLQLGAPRPPLAVKLVTGEPWALEAERGKVVLIQFSYKGCGPCELMYPLLRDLHEDHEHELSILSIMRDKDRSQTVEAVESGKMTWNVHWDGLGGPIVTRWAVTRFPTVYVIDRRGRVAAINLQGDELRKKVSELLKVAS